MQPGLTQLGLLLFVAALVAILTRRAHLPYTVGLVLAGMSLQFLHIQIHLDLSKDLIFYQPYDQGSVVRLAAGDVAIYFPPDAHMGAIATPARAVVRKVVVKVPALA